MVTDHGMEPRDAEVVIAAACLLHDAGMSIHRTDHEEYSLFLAADKLPVLLGRSTTSPSARWSWPRRSHADHRPSPPRRSDHDRGRRGARGRRARHGAGRSRVPFEEGRPNIHSLSAAAIDDVMIDPGRGAAVRIEIAMNNSSGLFQVDELLATKLRGSGIEEHLEVVAQHRGRAREAARAGLQDLRGPGEERS